MAERATIARPYATAAFEHAHEATALPQWSAGLAMAAAIVADERVTAATKSPKVLVAEVAGLVIDVAGSALDPAMQNFVRLLAENRRLGLLPEILTQFEWLRAEAENTADVELISAVALEEAQSGKLAQALSKRLQRTVRLHTSVDASLLGGAVIRAGDLVIDGSLKGRLERLQTELGN